MKEIKLTQGQIAFVDDDDFIILSNLNWWATKDDNKRGSYHARTRINGKLVYMHNFIINPPKGYVIDHKDNNGLNNCKANLRACNNSQNNMNAHKYSNNTSGFKGVHKHKYSGRFTCSLQLNKKRIYLGGYSNALEAAEAYDKGAKKYFGDFAKTNKSLGLLN